MQITFSVLFLSLQRCIQGAGLELQQLSSKDKEKSVLDRQHEHLIRCLEKATVGFNLKLHFLKSCDS